MNNKDQGWMAAKMKAQNARAQAMAQQKGLVKEEILPESDVEVPMPEVKEPSESAESRIIKLLEENNKLLKELVDLNHTSLMLVMNKSDEVKKFFENK